MKARAIEPLNMVMHSVYRSRPTPTANETALLLLQEACQQQQRGVGSGYRTMLAARPQLRQDALERMNKKRVGRGKGKKENCRIICLLPHTTIPT